MIGRIVVIRPLLIDDTQRQAVKHLVEFAKNPDAWYIVGQSKWIPGDNIEYVLHLNSYRCVFTYTLVPNGSLYRHLSVSIPGKEYPHPIAVYQLAHMFGFTGGSVQHGICIGPSVNWAISVNRDERCTVVVELVSQSAPPGKQAS